MFRIMPDITGVIDRTSDVGGTTSENRMTKKMKNKKRKKENAELKNQNAELKKQKLELQNQNLELQNQNAELKKEIGKLNINMQPGVKQKQNRSRSFEEQVRKIATEVTIDWPPSLKPIKISTF